MAEPESKPQNLNVANADEALSPTRFFVPGYLNSVWDVTPLARTTIDRLKDPTYWAHVSANMKQGDHIRAFWEDASQYAELIVLSISKNAARIAVLDHKVFTKTPEKIASQDPSNYEPEFLTGGEKWRVIRKSDKEVMVTGLDTEELAQEWIEENITKKAPKPVNKKAA